MPYPASDIDNTASSTHDQRPGPRLPYDDIIRDAIMDLIWNGDSESWNATKGSLSHRALKRELTSDEIYEWVNTHKSKIIEDTTNLYHHNEYLKGRKTEFHTKNYIKLLKDIVNGRKIVLDKYQTASRATQPEIEALKQMLQLPDNVRDWLKQQSLTDDEKILFNLIESADSGAGSGADATGSSADAEATTTGAGSSSSADAGGRRRRKTSFRRRRMSRSSKSKSKSKSKKSRKSRKCVR